MIATGTGIAPFISFFQEYYHRKSLNYDVNDLTLFFGSKNRDYDYIYEEELNKFQQHSILTNIYLAFSRDSVYIY
jgi:sulfite reductase alpha subunit-like flavoprotein